MKTQILTIAAMALFAAPAFAESNTSLEDKLRALAGSDGSYQIAQSCPYTGTKPCAPGPYGPGGCYNPSYADCKGGLVCTGGMKVCVPTNGSAAYCYAPQNGNCR